MQRRNNLNLCKTIVYVEYVILKKKKKVIEQPNTPLTVQKPPEKSQSFLIFNRSFHTSFQLPSSKAGKLDAFILLIRSVFQCLFLSI